MRPFLACLLTLLIAGPAAAQAPDPAPVPVQAVPQSAAQIQLSFAPIARATGPAVVNIFSRTVVAERRGPFTGDPLLDRMLRGPMRQRVQNSLGSGVIVSPDGLVVTNVHVVANSKQIRVVLADRREFEAKLLVADTQTDLAVLKLETEGKTMPVMPLGDSDAAEVGDLVLAIGNPFGVGQTVTSGIVSALSRSAEGINDADYFIQTDAAINPGNSGGALVDMGGRLIGINAAIYSRDGGSLGIGFAIPVNLVKTVIAAASGGQSRVTRPYLGAATQGVSADMADSLKLDMPQGVLLNDVAEVGSAGRAGLKTGDVVLRVDGHGVDSAEALRFRLATVGIGGTATLEVSRRGERLTVAMPLVGAPEVPPRQATLVEGDSPFAGATIANLSPALAEEIGYRGQPKGVVVTKVEDGSLAARIGLRPGDVLAAINRRALPSVGATMTILADPPRRWLLSVRRGAQVLTLAL